MGVPFGPRKSNYTALTPRQQHILVTGTDYSAALLSEKALRALR